MCLRHKRGKLFAGALLAGVGLAGVARAAPVTSNTSPVTMDGWTISWPTGIGLAINQDATTATQVDIEKSARFTTPNQGLDITFAPTATTGSVASVFVIPDEAVTNSTGSALTGFSFVLINSGSVNATFGGSTPGFKPPSGYTSVTLTDGKTVLSYVGSQADGSTSFWGNGDPSSAGDNLIIDAPAGADFKLEELPSASSGPPAVPLPASVWQSLFGLSGLGLVALKRRVIRREPA